MNCTFSLNLRSRYSTLNSQCSKWIATIWSINNSMSGSDFYSDKMLIIAGGLNIVFFS